MYSSPEWIYVPDITLQGSIGEFTSGLSITTPLVFYNGFVVWRRSGSITGVCTFDLDMFPFDTQNCSFLFKSTQMTYHDLALHVNPNPVPDFPGTVSWESLGNTMEKTFTLNSNLEITDGVIYYVAVKRYSKTYFSTCIMPNIVVSAIAVMSLYTSDAMARIGVALTAMLTIIAVMVKYTHFYYCFFGSISLKAIFYHLVVDYLVAASLYRKRNLA